MSLGNPRAFTPRRMSTETSSRSGNSRQHELGKDYGTLNLENEADRVTNLLSSRGTEQNSRIKRSVSKGGIELAAPDGHRLVIL